MAQRMNLMPHIKVAHFQRTDSKYNHSAETRKAIFIRITHNNLTSMLRSSLPDMLTKAEYCIFCRESEPERIMRDERDKIRGHIANYLRVCDGKFIPRKFTDYLHNVNVYENRQSLISDLQNAQRLAAQLANSNVRCIATEPVEEWETETMQAQVEILQEIVNSIKKSLPILID